MAEMLRSMGVVIGRRERKQEETLPLKPILEKSYAEVVKMPRSRGRDLVKVEVREKEISRNLRKLEHCLVGCWNLSSARREDLENLGILMAKAWGLKGKLGMAKMEKGKVLLEFESLVEAKRVLNSGKRSFGGIHLLLESWSPKTGCLVEGEKRSAAWVKIMGLPVFLWDLIILRRVGKECGGFLSIDSQSEKMEELQWARILVKMNGEDLPNVLEIWNEEVCYSLILWWEIRSSLRKASFDSRGKTNNSRYEVRGDINARVGSRVVEEEGDARLEVLQRLAERTCGQASRSGCKVDSRRSQNGSVAQPFEGLKLVSGLSKSGPLVDLKDFKLAGGLSKSSPLANLKLKGVSVVEYGPSSSKDFWWVGEEENNTTIGIDDLDGESSPGPSQLPLVDRAQNVMAHSPAWSGPRN